jgi:leader peptidase (prepilin peptidase) / N-methyltransferase
MDWAANLDAAAFGALVAAASGVLVPRIIERVPEPEPDEADGAEADEADESDESGAAPGADGQAPRFEGASQPDEGPKETYFAIADRPGLLWKCVLAALVSGGLIGRAVGWDWSLLFLLPLVPVSLALTVIDWRTKLLPTWLIARTYVGLIVLVLVATLATQDWDDLIRAGIGWASAGRRS